MELRQLRHFLAVAEHKHFGRAADAIHITQQALSSSIAQLEKDLGARLFDRGQFGAQLTEIGRTFETRAKLACAEIDLAAREVSALAGGARGHIRFGVSSVVASRILPRVVTKFARQRPQVGLSVSVDHSRMLYDELERGALEFLVSTPAEEPEAHPELEHEPIGDHFRFDANVLVMRAGHPLAQMEQPMVADLHACPWVMPETLGAHLTALAAYFQRHHLPLPEQVLRTDSFFCAKAIIAQSDYVALLGTEAAAAEIAAGMFVGLPLPGFESLLRGYFIYRRRSALQPAARELLRIFRSVIEGQVQETTA